MKKSFENKLLKMQLYVLRNNLDLKKVDDVINLINNHFTVDEQCSVDNEHYKETLKNKLYPSNMVLLNDNLSINDVILDNYTRVSIHTMYTKIITEQLKLQNIILSSSKFQKFYIDCFEYRKELTDMDLRYLCKVIVNFTYGLMGSSINGCDVTNVTYIYNDTYGLKSITELVKREAIYNGVIYMDSDEYYFNPENPNIKDFCQTLTNIDYTYEIDQISYNEINHKFVKKINYKIKNYDKKRKENS